MNIAKILVLLLVLVAVVAIVELLRAPHPSETPNPKVTDGVYDRIMPGMTEKQIEELLGQPHEVRGGEVVKLQEPDSSEAGFEIADRPLKPTSDLVNIYRGRNGERILVLLAAGSRTAVGVGYSVEEVPILFKGHAAWREKPLSPLSLDRPMPPELQTKIYHFLLSWSLRKGKSSPLSKELIFWERKLISPGVAPPPPPPPPGIDPTSGPPAPGPAATP